MAIEQTADARAGEQDLLTAAQAGDGLAYRRLVEPHLSVLLRIGWRVSGSRELAEDAVQETLTIAFERLASYRHDTPFRAYLTSIVARQAYTLVRSERRRRVREEGASHPQAPAGPEDEIRAATVAQHVREALLAMPEKRRNAALMRLDAGLSYRDIALALESTEGSTRVLVHTALKELREKLSHLLPEEHHERSIP
jgi:RNA polymerase sigma-70 factor (ECF subfamily)